MATAQVFPKTGGPVKLTLEEFARVRLEPLLTTLPDVTTLGAVSFDLERQFSATAATLWQHGAKQLFGGIGRYNGVSFPKELVVIREIVIQQVSSIVAEQIKRGVEELTQRMLQGVLKGIADTLSNIPIVGAVVRILWGVGKLTAEGVRNANRYGSVVIEERPFAFVPHEDTGWYNIRILPRVSPSPDTSGNVVWEPGSSRTVAQGQQRRDFSQLFAPLSLGSDPRFGLARVKGPLRFRISVVRERINPWSVGYVPGTDGFLHVGFQGMLPSQDLGSFLPTGASETATLWGNVAKNGPSQYAVNVRTLVLAWESYFDGLLRYLADQDALPVDWIVKLARAYSAPDAFGWTLAPGEPTKRAGLRRWLAKTDVRNATPLESARWLARAQRANLKTITCAYVDPNFAAFDNDPVLAHAWETSREALLRHSARVEVDADAIPDLEYRERMLRAQRAGLVTGYAAAPMPDPEDVGKPPYHGKGGGVPAAALTVGAVLAAALYAARRLA